MADQLTEEQLTAVNDRGGKLLVSAAAGSGKTKVLVERVMSYLRDPVSPANLDDFLIITYTKAAAAELRGKIASKLGQEIAADPGNRHLQKQLQRLYLAKISTVHSFCTDILREHAYHLDIPVDFRVAEENECNEMQHLVVEKMLDEVYLDLPNNADFSAFVDIQGFGRNDRKLPELVLKLYKSARCHMDPNGWLDWCLDVIKADGIEDISGTLWGRYLIDDLHRYLDLQINALSRCAEHAADAEGMAKPVALLYATIERLTELRSCERWDEIARFEVDFGKLDFPRKNLDIEKAAHIKAVRENCKKGVQSKLRKFTDTSQQVLADMADTIASARGLIEITRRFMVEYDNLKKRRRVLDFGDLEHKTLDLLMGKRRYGPTMIAAEIGGRFREVMVDEYQDSNAVQDAIFSAITEERQNCFMVGDVKQSIYQFRLADPDIFLRKYNEYVPTQEAKPGEGRKVMLSKNFRSGRGVINAVNDVFSACMSEKVGGLTYGEDEKLYEGTPHDSLKEAEVELYGIVADDEAYEDEAAFITQRVLQLLDGTHMIRDGKEMHAIRPEDIAILLRSPGSVGHYYIDALNKAGIRCRTGDSTNILETEEVQTLRAILQVIDNPLQDIPLIAVLTSRVFGFTADDLAFLRSGSRHVSIFDALQKDESAKSSGFVSIISTLRQKARVSTLLGLIKHTLLLTQLDSIFGSLPDGEARIENILSFYKIVTEFDRNGGKSLKRFLIHLEALDDKGVTAADEQSASGAVTVMSIHKSKGLEFPVVFLPALSRQFNQENAYANMLCDKDLGLGLSCVDTKNRVRYPSVSKRAISAKIRAEGRSEEMRVFYVAMTRAKDRLIMTYTSKKLDDTLNELSLRMPYTDPELLTSEANCPGRWVLYSALRRSEAGAFFAITTQPDDLMISNTPWIIKIVDKKGKPSDALVSEVENTPTIPTDVIEKMRRSLIFDYSFNAATKTPSKLTATQIKGREKDLEIAEATSEQKNYAKNFRKPTFSAKSDSGLMRGNALHTVMQYIRYDHCTSSTNVSGELDRLVREGYIACEQAEIVDSGKIARFFDTEIGKSLCQSKNVLREFKFSILNDAGQYDPAVSGEEVLVQGVVDCALIDDDGITVIDFKTDRVNESTVFEAAQRYRSQIDTYANALKRIYQKPVKAVMLYFFEPELFVTV